MSVSTFLVGLGRRGRVHLETLRQSQEFFVVGGYDPGAGSWRATTTLPRIFESIEQGLSATQPELVIVSTPPSARLEPVAAILRGARPRWLVLEKPLALDMNSGLKLIELCHRAGTQLVLAHQVPYAPEFGALLDWARSGVLGEIGSMRLSCHGSLFDQGSHLMDLVGRLIGAPAAGEWVQAHVADEMAVRALASVPADYERDDAHRGAAHFSGQLRTLRGQSLFIECGLLAPHPIPQLGWWRQKRIVVEGEHGFAEAHVMSHARLCVANQPARRVESSESQYYASLPNFYRALLDGKLDSDNEHDLGTLRRLTALTTAAQRRTVQSVMSDIHVPPRETDHVFPLSVILPLGDDRGLAQRAVASWTREQEAEADSFELVIIASRAHAGLTDAVRPLLRPQDRIIEHDGENETAQYHFGARQARGEYLVFTEAHVWAEPQAIGEILAYCARGVVDGFCGRMVPEHGNIVSRMEAQLHAEQWAVSLTPDHFSKVILTLFVLSRRYYFLTLGLQSRYHRFAEVMLAAELRRLGCTLAYAPGVGVTHRFNDNVQDVERFICEMISSECRYRLEGTDGDDYRGRYFGEPEEWHQARKNNPRTLRFARRALWQLVVSRSRVGAAARGRALREWMARVWANPAAGRGLLWRWQLTRQVARGVAALPLLPFSWRFAAFRRYWLASMRYWRVHFAFAAVVSNPTATAPQGFHEWEAYQGRRFRWSEPFAAFPIAADDESRRVTLRLLRIGKPNAFIDTRFWMGNAHLSASCIQDGDDIVLSVDVPPQARDQWLYSLAPALRAADKNETRSLGLPVVETQFVSAVSGNS